MGQPELSEQELGLDKEPLQSFPELKEATPLWYYILCEAAAQEVPFGTGTLRGAQLGPVGGRIVAEVLLGLVMADPTSFLNTDERWEPTLGETPRDFCMADLIRIAQGAPASRRRRPSHPTRRRRVERARRDD
jgi:hypothetical protein